MYLRLVMRLLDRATSCVMHPVHAELKRPRSLRGFADHYTSLHRLACLCRNAFFRTHDLVIVFHSLVL